MTCKGEVRPNPPGGVGIIHISILDLCVNPRQSIVICDPRIYSFLTVDTGRLTQINADELDQVRLHDP